MVVDTLQDKAIVQQLLAGCDAVVHLAAIASPMSHPPETVYANNTLSSYHVLLAAAELGIRKVCLASSINAIGGAFSRMARYDYLPVDERHPTYAEDAYSLSKWVLEAQADAVARLHPEMTIASMRFHGLNKRSFFPPDAHPNKLPPEWAQRVINHLWAYTDIDSAAKACMLALQADFKGHEAFLVVGPTTIFPATVSSRELAQQHFPAAELSVSLPTLGNVGLYDCSKAQRLLGWVHEDL